MPFKPLPLEDHALAERVKLLLAFCADLIPDMERIKEVVDEADDRTSTAMAVAPILGAFGKDYEEVHLEASLRARRAKALYKLIKVLDETEKEREEFRRTNALKKQNLAVLMSHLGMS